MPDGWEWCRINQIFNFIDYRGATPNKISEGVPLVTAKNVKFGYIDYAIDEYISKEEYLQRQQRGVSQKGDILFTTEAPLGNVAIADLDNFSAGQRLITFQQYNKGSNLVNELFMFFIMSNFFQQQLQTNKTGSTVAGIKAALLKTLWLPVPPANEQRQIVDFCKALFKHIEDITNNRDNVIKLVGTIKSKILDLAIRGKLVPQNPNDEPASVLLEHIRAEKEELIKQGKIKRDKKESVIFKGEDNSYYEKIGDTITCIDDELPFEIPDNWTWSRGLSCFEGMSSRNPIGDFFRYIDIDSIDNKNHCVIFPKEIAVQDAPSRAKRAVENGSVVFSLVRPYLENIAFIDESLKDCIASTGFYICKSNGAFYPEYMFHLMTSKYVVSGLNQYMKGDNSPSISKDNIENWLYPIPSFNEQIRIVNRIHILQKIVQSIEASLK